MRCSACITLLIGTLAAGALCLCLCLQTQILSAGRISQLENDAETVGVEPDMTHVSDLERTEKVSRSTHPPRGSPENAKVDRVLERVRTPFPDIASHVMESELVWRE